MEREKREGGRRGKRGEGGRDRGEREGERKEGERERRGEGASGWARYTLTFHTPMFLLNPVDYVSPR